MTQFPAQWGRGAVPALLAAVFLGTGITGYAQDTGFLFGGGGGLFTDAATSESFDDPTQNRMRGSAGAFAFAGWRFSPIEVGLEAGYTPKNYYLTASDDTYTEYSQIPILVRVAYATRGAFSFKPNLFAGLTLDVTAGTPEIKPVYGLDGRIVTPGTPASGATIDTGLLFGAGLDLSYMFSGDHMGVFARAAYNFMIPLNGEGWWRYPLFGGGIIVYPFSAGSAPASRGGGGGKAPPRRSYGVRPANGYYTAQAAPEQQDGGGVDSALLSAMRTEGPGAAESRQTQPAASNAQAQTPVRQTAAKPISQNANGKPAATGKQPASSDTPPPPRLPDSDKPPQAANGGKKAAPPEAAPEQGALALTKQEQAEIAATKKTVEEQRKEIANLKKEVENQRKELNTLKTSTQSVAEIQLAGGALDNPVRPGSKLDTVYFPPNETQSMVVFSLPVLDEVGKKLQAESSLIVSIRGYSASAGTEDGQRVVSETRARYCAEYLNSKYGISFERMTIEWFGATRSPERAGDYKSQGLYRAVELVTRQNPVAGGVAGKTP